MAIIKTSNLVETYKAKAKSKDINELTGRTGRPDLTKFVINQMIKNIKVVENSTLIDIGCGDGMFLQMAAANGINSFIGRLVGILPTIEEVIRVRTYLATHKDTNNNIISIEYGLAEKTSLPNEFADIVVCNGVLHGGGQTIGNVKAALNEFNRILKIEATLFIGEMPDIDELAGKNYGDSITSWLLWVLKNQGIKQFWIRLKQTATGIIGKEPFVIAPKNMFFMPPNRFIQLLSEFGFEVKQHYKHREIDMNGIESDSKTRWNYIAVKTKPTLSPRE